MTSKRLENFALIMGIMAAFTVYSSAKEPPIKTSGLFTALLFAFACYGLSRWSARVAEREKAENDQKL